MATITRIQADPAATVDLKWIGETPSADGSVEIVITDPTGAQAGVVELTAKQVAAICEIASEM